MKINDVFWTVQGEGTNWGRRALFVRMPYCNLKCSWCDTQFNSYKEWSSESLSRFCDLEPARFAVITGGEPMMNKQTPMLVEMLKKKGFTIACETNGTFPIVDGIDFVTVSPKEEANFIVSHSVLKKANDLKLIVDDAFSFETARHFELAAEQHTNLFLSPEHGTMEKSVERILQFQKERPRWRLNLQTHKIIKVP